MESTATAARRHAGIDWSWNRHAVCVVDEHGQIVERFEVEHRARGLAQLTAGLRRLGVDRVAVERGDGPLVDALRGAGLDVAVVSSRQVKSLRLRYGVAGNKDDRFDAFVLADTVRTDGHRLASLRPDSPATQALRALVRARKDLIKHRLALANQLRANLLAAFPGAVGLFGTLDSPISLRFLVRFPTWERAAWLSERRLAAWLRAAGYCGRQTAEDLYAHLEGAPAGLTGPAGEAHGAITVRLVGLLEAVRQRIGELDARIAEALALHPDAPIFTGLPRAGTNRAALLLAEIGDCRERFPDESSLAAAAGVAPSTRASGKRRGVVFRHTCDKKLREALVDFAADSVRASDWARRTYERARARGCRHPHAVRILARAWVRVIWRCWVDGVPYDPSRHRGAMREALPA